MKKKRRRPRQERAVYAAVSANHVNKIPPKLRPEIRKAVCADCKSPVIFHGPTYDQMRFLSPEEPAVLCGACVQRWMQGEEEYLSLHPVTPEVSRAFGEAEAERN